MNSDLELIVASVKDELIRAMGRYRPSRSAHEAFAIIKEEVDELWEAVRTNNTHKVYYETVQVAAMAIRLLYDYATNQWEGHVIKPNKI
ncbi:MAG: hypothetical protein KatS3mg087_1331 [Patescibacteria group bacterium]|nr:MAG: hypothetical protein KatS3mg087_1331 [Patescibacteria group bacterium]